MGTAERYQRSVSWLVRWYPAPLLLLAVAGPAWVGWAWAVLAIGITAGLWLEVLAYLALALVERVGARLERRPWQPVGRPHLCICPTCRAGATGVPSGRARASDEGAARATGEGPARQTVEVAA